jgi:hypothetical protein
MEAAMGDMIDRDAAIAKCRAIADEAKFYGMPQMAMGGYASAEAIAALPPAPDAVKALDVIRKNGAEATATAMILHIAETLQSRGKAVLTTGDDFGAQVLEFAAALAAIRAGGKP